MKRRRTDLRWMAVVMTALSISLACDDAGLSPDAAPVLTVQMTRTGIEARVILEIWAEGDAPLPVSVRTARGELEEGRLVPVMCESNGDLHVCDEFVVEMEEGVDVRSVASRADVLLYARLLLEPCAASGDCDIDFSSRGVVAFFGDDLDAAMDPASAWPGVRSVAPNPVPRTPPAIPDPSRAIVERLPVDHALIEVRDGRVQAEPGALIVVAYRGANGRTVRDSVRVPDVPLVEDERLPRAIVEVLRNTVRGIEDRRREALRSTDAFQEFWDDAFVGEAPPVDFETSMVLGVSMGQRNTGGYGIRVDSVVYRSGDRYDVFVTETSPGDDCFPNARGSWPVYMVRVPRVEGEVTFVERQVVRSCS